MNAFVGAVNVIFCGVGATDDGTELTDPPGATILGPDVLIELLDAPYEVFASVGTADGGFELLNVLIGGLEVMAGFLFAINSEIRGAAGIDALDD